LCSRRRGDTVIWEFRRRRVGWSDDDPHCGDTIWHGHWQRIGRAYGPFDVAFLPINGFAQTDLVPSTTVPYAMTPEVALQAARLLGAQTVVPIHFGRAPSQTYIETDAPDAASSTRREGSARQCACCVPATSSSSPRSREATVSATQRCETSIHSAPASAASRSGAMRSAACVSPAAGTTTSNARSDTSA